MLSFSAFLSPYPTIELRKHSYLMQAEHDVFMSADVEIAQ
jgi:hypothetical protein